MLARILCLFLVLALAAQSDFINKEVGSKYGDIDVSKLSDHVSGLKDKLKEKMMEKVEDLKEKAANKPPVLYNVLATSTDCDAGSPSSLIHFDDVSFSPLTVQVPGNITVSAKVTLDNTLSAPITVAVDMKKKVLNWWVTVPCTSDNVGSCTYDDACQYMPNAGKSDSEPCPKEFADANLPCKCPVSKDVYQVTDYTLAIPKPSVDLPLSGDYQVTVRISQAGTEIGCVQLSVNVQEQRNKKQVQKEQKVRPEKKKWIEY